MPSLKSTTTKKALLPVDPEGVERGSRYVHLTQGFLNNLGPADERIRLTDIRSIGLSVRLEPSGHHSWQVRLQSKTGSRQLWETFGKVADMSLKEARGPADDDAPGDGVTGAASVDPHLRLRAGECGGGFSGEEETGVVGQSAGDGDALLFAA